MITNICLLLEILSVLLCVHHLYGEKFKLDIITTSFLAVYMIFMTAINYYELPKICTMVMYPAIAIYCGVKFGFKWRAIIVNSVLYLVILGGIQLIVLLVCGLAFGSIQMFADLNLLLVNCIVFMIVVLLVPKFRLYRLAAYLQDKERILFISLVISIVVAMYCILSYKKANIIELNQSVLLFIAVTFICILAMQLTKYRVKAKEIETELKMHQLYADSFQSLIENIRLKQHEFDNHINTIYSQHYMYDTYEELVNAQKNYCQDVIQDNRYNKLLKAGNPLIIGFLYGKFIEIEKSGIKILYKIVIEEFNVGIPAYKLVEILGNLIKNAVEALAVSEKERVLYVEIVEVDGEFEIEVRNKSKVIPSSELEKFFKKGFSKKGEERGVGLYNVKMICNEYALNILCENKIIEGENWLSFAINNKKGTIVS